MSQYTIHKNGNNEGPLTLEEARAGLASGRFSGSDLAWRPGLTAWAPLAQRIAEDTGEAPPPVPPAIHTQAAAGATPAPKSGVGTGVIIAVVLGIGALVAIVIIGLLAALAIPAFKKVRNNAIEKSMVNDARQISAALNQVCAEQDKKSATIKELGAYIPGLSAGNTLVITDRRTGMPIHLRLDSPDAGTVTLPITGKITLSNPNYDHTFSSNPVIAGQPAPDRHDIVFEVESGRVAGE